MVDEADGGTCSIYAAARRIGRHPKTVRRWIDEGLVEAEPNGTGGFRVSIASLDSVAREAGDSPDEGAPEEGAPVAGAGALLRELSGVARGLSAAVKALTESSVRREELYLDHLETLLTKTVAFAEASQQKNQDLIIGWEKAQSEATERQLATQTMVNEEERKNIMVQWAMESIPQMFTAGKATKKLLDLARTLTDQQIGAMSILLSEEQMVAIREVVKAARGNQPEQPANEAEKKEAQ